MAQLPSQFRVEGNEVDEQGRNSWGQIRFFSPPQDCRRFGKLRSC